MSIIRANNLELTNGVDHSSLSSASTSGSSSISVYSISKFAVDQILLIGDFGQEGSEIILTHAATSPTGTTITLASNLVKDHPKDTKVYIIPYNQVVFYNATTITGVKNALDTIDIDPEKENTTYSDNTGSGYYFVRWYDSINNTYGEYSDPIPYSGFISNTVGYVINHSLGELNKEITDTLTYDILIGEINACLRFVRGKLKRWSDVQKFNYELDDSLVEDDYTWTLPDDYYDPNSNRSMLQVWITDKDNLTYVDKQEFDDLDRDATNGTPKFYTIYDGSIYITPKVGSSYAGDSIYMDYYTEIVEVDSDSDEITLARYDMVKHWLKWQIRNIVENNGKMDFEDGDWKMFSSILNDAIRRESSGQKYKMTPSINGISYRNEFNSNFDIE